MKKTYITPSITAVEFKVEKGFASSLDPEETFAGVFELYNMEQSDKGMEQYTIANGWNNSVDAYGNWVTGTGDSFF